MVKWGTSWKNLGGVSLRKTEVGGYMEGGNRWNHGVGAEGRLSIGHLGALSSPHLGKGRDLL